MLQKLYSNGEKDFYTISDLPDWGVIQYFDGSGNFISPTGKEMFSFDQSTGEYMDEQGRWKMTERDDDLFGEIIKREITGKSWPERSDQLGNNVSAFIGEYVKAYEEQLSIANGSLQNEFRAYQKKCEDIKQSFLSRAKDIADKSIQRWENSYTEYSQKLAAHDKRWISRLLRPRAFYQERADILHGMNLASEEITKYDYQLNVAWNRLRDEYDAAIESYSVIAKVSDDPSAEFVNVKTQETADRITGNARQRVEQKDSRAVYEKFCRQLGKEPKQIFSSEKRNEFRFSAKEKIEVLKRELGMDTAQQEPLAQRVSEIGSR